MLLIPIGPALAQAGPVFFGGGISRPSGWDGTSRFFCIYQTGRR
jgi:hypothetical protein